MKYYPHHIGDFNNATRHLTRVERSVYRDAIEYYYDTEEPLCADDMERLQRRLLVFSEEEKAALAFVLEEFFTLTGNLYTHNRCDEEIERYRSTTSAKAKAGKASAEARRAASQERINKRSADVEQMLNASPTNQEPITNNHKPENNKTTKQSRAVALDYSGWPEIPSDQVLQDWLEMRKRLKANVSQTVINNFAVELNKAAVYGYSVDRCLAECVTRNWRGFKFDWLKEDSGNATRQRFNRETLSERANRAADEAFGTGSQSGILEGCFDVIDENGPSGIAGSRPLPDLGGWPVGHERGSD